MLTTICILALFYPPHNPTNPLVTTCAHTVLLCYLPTNLHLHSTPLAIYYCHLSCNVLHEYRYLLNLQSTSRYYNLFAFTPYVEADLTYPQFVLVAVFSHICLNTKRKLCKLDFLQFSTKLTLWGCPGKDI